MDFDDLRTLVTQDLQDGLAPGLELTSELKALPGLVPPALLEPGARLPAGPQSLPWQVMALHRGQFQGIPASRRTLDIRGVTFITDLDTGLEDVDEAATNAKFHRFIDWVSVFSQMGVAITTRVHSLVV